MPVYARPWTRRYFLQTASAGAAAIALGCDDDDTGAAAPDGGAPDLGPMTDDGVTPDAGAGAGRPPHLVLMTTDQEHPWMWFDGDVDTLLPGRGFLRRYGVSFDNAFCVATPCSPSRSSLYTGLHPFEHQVYGNAGFDGNYLHEFPTIARVLRHRHGYQTTYIGKSHLASMGSTPCATDRVGCGMEPYGFDTWVTAELGPTVRRANGEVLHPPWSDASCYDSPGIPNEAGREDEEFTEAVLHWLDCVGAGGDACGIDPDQPWFTVFSLVNPHDIAFFPRLARRYTDGETQIPDYELPADLQLPDPGVLTVPRQATVGTFEPTSLLEANKPRAQVEYQRYIAVTTGRMPTEYDDPTFDLWAQMNRYYLQVTQDNDRHVQAILRQILGLPRATRERLVLAFTSDHGEKLGAHGQVNKAVGAYEEEVRVPLVFIDFSHPDLLAMGDAGHDPFGGAAPPQPAPDAEPARFVDQPGAHREAMVTHFDMVATLLDLAADGDPRPGEVPRTVDTGPQLGQCAGGATLDAEVSVDSAQMRGLSMRGLLRADDARFGAVDGPLGATTRFVLHTSSSNWSAPNIEDPYHLVSLRARTWNDAGGVDSDWKLNLWYAWPTEGRGPAEAWAANADGSGPGWDPGSPLEVELYDMTVADPDMVEVENMLPARWPSAGPAMRRAMWADKRVVVKDEDGTKRPGPPYEGDMRDRAESLYAQLFPVAMEIIRAELTTPLNGRLGEVQRRAWATYNGQAVENPECERDERFEEAPIPCVGM